MMIMHPLYVVSGFDGVPMAVEWGYFVDTDTMQLLEQEIVYEPMIPFCPRDPVPAEERRVSKPFPKLRKRVSAGLGIVEIVWVSIVTAILVWCWLSYFANVKVE